MLQNYLWSPKKIVSSGIYHENDIVSGIDPGQQSKEDVLDRRVSIFQVTNMKRFSYYLVLCSILDLLCLF